MRNKSISKNTLLYGCINILLMLGSVSTDGQIGCPNLVVNGDFQAGNTGFTSGLALSCDPVECQVGSYCVGNEFRSKCNLWPDDFWDHTLMNANGSFMSIDGNLNSAVDVWSTTVNVSTGVAYEFGFWAASVYNANSQQFDLGFVINSALQTPTAFISQTPPAWTYYSTTWVSNVTGTIPISIRQMTAGAFRDFGLDDIRFSCVSCHPDFIAVPEPCGTVQFINQSQGQLPATFFWDFDDPNSGASNTSTLDNPSHQFSSCGSFSVCLTIIAANGCIETICKPVTPIAESVPPVALCQPGQGYDLLANCTLPLTVAMIDAGSFDNCQIQSMVVSPAVIQGCGVFPVTLTVTDWCGNVSTCNTEVQTVEVVPPTIQCPQAISVTASAPDCSIAVQNIQALGVTDNCSTPTVTYTTLPATTGGSSSSDASGSVFGAGTTIVTYTATDDCGNMASCSFEVTVLCDSCCDLAAFCLAIENAVSITLNEDSCKATLHIGNLPCDEYLEWVDWGDGQQDFGPYFPGDMPMHAYTGGGTYHISYLAIALDPATGFICLEKVLTDTITLTCNPCEICPDNIVQNSGFHEGAVPGELGGSGSTNNWVAVAGTPDLSVNIPHCDPMGVQMFGSMDVGEAIAQAGLSFTPGNSYAVSFSAHFFQAAGTLVPFVQFEFYASNSLTNPYPACGGCELIGTSPQITNTTYQTFTLPNWTPSQGFNTLIIKALNTSNSPLISFGRIDNICIDVLVGLQETPSTLPLRVYPNPTTNQFTLELPEPAAPGTTLRITSLAGQVLRSLPVEAGTPRQELDAGNLPAGLYFVQVWSEGRLAGTTKLVKQ
jgi:hypothetical protein